MRPTSTPGVNGGSAAMSTHHEADLGVRTAAERGTRPTSRRRAGACSCGGRERRTRGREGESGGLNPEHFRRPISRSRFTSRPLRACALLLDYLRASPRCPGRARVLRPLSPPIPPVAQASGVTDERAQASLLDPARTGRARTVRTTARQRSKPLRRPAWLPSDGVKSKYAVLASL